MGGSSSSQPTKDAAGKNKPDKPVILSQQQRSIFSYLWNPLPDKNVMVCVQIPEYMMNNAVPVAVNVAAQLNNAVPEKKAPEQDKKDDAEEDTVADVGGEIEDNDQEPGGDDEIPEIEEEIDEETNRAMILSVHPDIDWDNLAGEPELLKNGIVSIRPTPNGVRMPRPKKLRYTDPDANEGSTFRKVIIESTIGRRGAKLSLNIPYAVHVYMLESMPGPMTMERHTSHVSSYRCERWALNFVTYRNNSSTTVRWVVQLRQLQGVRALLEPIGEVQPRMVLENAGEIEFVEDL